RRRKPPDSPARYPLIQACFAVKKSGATSVHSCTFPVSCHQGVCPMELRILGIAASVALLTGWSGPAAAPQQSVTYTAQMNGTAATPPNTEKATGTATLTLAGNQLRYTITVQGLSGPATAAHIDVGKVGAADYAGVARQPPDVRREEGLEAVESGADSIPVATVNVTPPTASLAVGATQQLTATTLDASGNILTGRVVI